MGFYLQFHVSLDTALCYNQNQLVQLRFQWKSFGRHCHAVLPINVINHNLQAIHRCFFDVFAYSVVAVWQSGGSSLFLVEFLICFNWKTFSMDEFLNKFHPTKPPFDHNRPFYGKTKTTARPCSLLQLFLRELAKLC